MLISSRTFGPVSLDLNAGGTVRSGDGVAAPKRASIWAAALGIPLVGTLGWAAELYGFPGTAGPGGALEGKVVELQAFPSGYAMMTYFSNAWRDELRALPGLDQDWTCFAKVSPTEGYDIMRRTLCGETDPREVALVDFEPLLQKTVPDFVATRKLFGVETVCATELIKRGRSLFRREKGLEVPVKRIYNRMVFDELQVKGYKLPFDFRDDLDVTWASHPNWYWVWSKYALPFIDHPALPRARFLSDLKEIPADLSRYVLKPLFSFAGSGVVIEVSLEDIARVPEAQRDRWVLQEKIEYAAAVIAPGNIEVKAEIRVMLLRPPDASRLVPLILLTRLSRGKMIGVDQNRGTLDWQGGSVGIWPSAQPDASTRR